MLKLTYCLHRLPSLTRAQFQDYWGRIHAPLVQERAALLRIRRYVQVHALSDVRLAPFLASRGGPQAYDGIAEVWFETVEDVLAGQDDPRVRQAGRELYEDELRFIDLPRSPLFFAQVHEVVSGSGRGRDENS